MAELCDQLTPPPFKAESSIFMGQKPERGGPKTGTLFQKARDVPKGEGCTTVTEIDPALNVVFGVAVRASLTLLQTRSYACVARPLVTAWRRLKGKAVLRNRLATATAQPTGATARDVLRLWRVRAQRRPVGARSTVGGVQ